MVGFDPTDGVAGRAQHERLRRNAAKTAFAHTMHEGAVRNPGGGKNDVTFGQIVDIVFLVQVGNPEGRWSPFPDSLRVPRS